MKKQKKEFRFIELSHFIKNIDVYLNNNEEIKNMFIPYEKTKYIIAVSGGPDSIFLCYLYYIFYKKKYIDTPIIFHFNHNIREDSHHDEELVFLLSQKLKLPFYVSSGNALKLSKKLKLNLEESARILRYRALFKLSRKFDDNVVIITGHHGDDYLETIFLRLTRGSSLRNIDFNPLRKVPVKIANNIYFLKVLSPLLLFDKEQILNVLHQKKIPYVLDKTNNDLQYKRNQIRFKILPLLKNFGIYSGILWQKTHLNVERFKNEIIHHDYIILNKSLFYNLGNKEIKRIFDQITNTLTISPINTKVISEFIHQSYSSKIYIQTKECIIESVKNQIWFINSNTTLLKEPVINNNIINWYHQERNYDLAQNEVLCYLKIEKDIKLKDHLKEILRDKEIPKILRYNIPYIKVYDKKIIIKRILFSFLPDWWDMYLNST